jgi:hypothetical protein
MATCRICLEGGNLIRPCMCNDIGHFHQECLQKWVDTSGNEKCEICTAEFHNTYSYYFDLHDYCKRLMFIIPSSSFEKKLIVASIPSIMLINICTLMSVVFKLTDIVEINSIALLSTSIVLWPSVALQLIRRDLPFFVLNVVMVWKSGYTFLVCVSCIIFLSYADDDCFRGCIALYVSEGCSDVCPIYEEYSVTKEEILISMQNDLIQFVIVFVLRAIVIFTQKRKKRVFISISEV